MDARKRAKLEAAGFTVGTAEQFLGLTPEENELVEVRLALVAALRRRRENRKLTQTALAKKLGSSQSRVAKMEAGDTSVTLDLLVRTMLALGATREELGRIIWTGQDRSREQPEDITVLA